MMYNINMSRKGIILAGGVNNIGDIEGSNKLNEAKELGASLK